MICALSRSYAMNFRDSASLAAGERHLGVFCEAAISQASTKCPDQLWGQETSPILTEHIWIMNFYKIQMKCDVSDHSLFNKLPVSDCDSWECRVSRLLVGSPWSGFPENRMGDVYKCPVDVPTDACEKLNLQSELFLAMRLFTNSESHLSETQTKMTTISS